MHLLLVISSLRVGGAEKICTTVANFWADRGIRVSILLLADSSQKPFFTLNPKIHLEFLGILKDSKNIYEGFIHNISRLKILRNAIKKTAPEAVISFMDKTNILVLLALVGLKIPVIVSERSDPKSSLSNALWSLARITTYCLARQIVVQSKEAFCCFPFFLRRIISIIPNPIVLPLGESHNPVLVFKKQCIIWVGRLSKEKCPELLMEAFSMVHEKYKNWHLLFLGDGPLKSELVKKSSELGIVDQVFFPGTVKNIWDYLRQADIYVASSRYEGFPNALLEAMACGLPVISTDCPVGPRAIIRNGENGILVPNQDRRALSDALEVLMSDEKMRIYLGHNARKVTAQYDLERIMRMWDGLIELKIDKALCDQSTS